MILFRSLVLPRKVSHLTNVVARDMYRGGTCWSAVTPSCTTATWTRRFFTTAPLKNNVSATPTGPSNEPDQDVAATAESAVSADRAQLNSELIEMKRALDVMEEELSQSDAKCAELQDRLLRALAENENARQRYEKEIENSKQYAISKFAEAILEVADNLELALQHCNASVRQIDVLNMAAGEQGKMHRETQDSSVIEGVKLTHNVLMNAIGNFGITCFDPINEPFNPKLHEALFEMSLPEKFCKICYIFECHQAKGTVVQVIKKGYKIRERILRPAKVGTAK